ncbi:MAG: hypothetical protein SGJ20_16915 [Planctomycetota bacterium]|nr:hypothetical protein [Planctomycetota bacterium]
MIDPLADFNWSTLYHRYDGKCRGFDQNSQHLSRFEADRPVTDRQLYYRLVDCYSKPIRDADRNPASAYRSVLYWKLYSQGLARANLNRWFEESSAISQMDKRLCPFLAELGPDLPRDADLIIQWIKKLNHVQLIGMANKCAIPVRSTFLHFLFPTTVPIFDKMVLQAVGVTEKDANKSYDVLREYLPFAWELADRYADVAAESHVEQPIRLIDMALWVHRGR